MFKDPVFNESGNTYERSAILELWKRRDDFFDPLFNTSLRGGGLWPNWDKRRGVQDFLAEHRTYVPEGWESREVPSLQVEEKVIPESQFSMLFRAMFPKRRSMRVLALAIGCLIIAVGSLIVEFTCLSEAMGKMWPCSQLDALLHKYSAWYFAPFSIIFGAVIIGAILGVAGGMGLVFYICGVWLLQLLPGLACFTLAHLRGRHAMAHAHTEAQRSVQARLLAQAEADAQARAAAQERAIALEQSMQQSLQCHQSEVAI
jgi:hypothetical protein